MATTTVLENVVADSVQTDELNSGNLIVRGAAKFVNPIYAEIHGSQDINQVVSGTVANNAYVLFSNGTNLFKVSYADLIQDLSTKVSVTFADSEGVGY